jgi:predicted TIM-barrel fold metal-dependent hydrolase
VTIEMMRKYPNVFGDTSGVKRFDYLVEAVQRAGSRKLLFGSDGPWMHPGVELAKLRLLHLQPKALRAVLGQNCWQILAGTGLSRQ